MSLRSLQNVKVFALAEEAALNTVPSLPYDGIIANVMAPESLKEHLERIVFASSEDSQAPSGEPDLQTELASGVDSALRREPSSRFGCD